MKVSIGSKIIEGPWGGGNLFVKNFSKYLINLGHEVIFDLSDSDIDLVLLTDPRSRKESSSTFNHIDIENYKKFVNPNIVVVQRINECDERKGTDFINKFYLEASETSDHVVFVSSWLRRIYLDLGMDKKKTSVILAGANKEIFNNENSSYWNRKDKLKLVTHHWSNHLNKGFEDYKEIDNMLSSKKWSNLLEFTYIGNFNENFKIENINLLPPLDGESLASEIKKHHVYITASINEPSGNHHIEAAQCGLPIIYKNSGGIPEYCNGFGYEFENNLEEVISKVRADYDSLKVQMDNYSLNSIQMCEEFFELFEILLSKRNKLQSNKLTLKGRVFLFKNKFLKIIRDNFYLYLKNKLIKNLKRILK